MTKKTLRQMPLGTRYRYTGETGPVYVVLQKHGRGLVASWQGNDGPLAGQGIFCFAESEEDCEKLQVYVVD